MNMKSKVKIGNIFSSSMYRTWMIYSVKAFFFFLLFTKDFMYNNFPMHLGASYLKKPRGEAFAN